MDGTPLGWRRSVLSCGRDDEYEFAGLQANGDRPEKKEREAESQVHVCLSIEPTFPI